MTHKEPLAHRAAGPTGTGAQQTRAELVPPDLPPGAVRYESADVNPGSIARALVGLVVATALVVAVLIPVFKFFGARARRADPPAPPMGQHEPGRLPVEPRLQTMPARDLAAIREEDERLLNSYGWVDETNGVVHIPIDEAMRMMAARAASPPAPSPAATAPAPGTRR